MNVRDLCDAAENCQDDGVWPQPLDLAALSRTEPTPPQFIMDDWLPCGYATLFAGHGGVGTKAASRFISRYASRRACRSSAPRSRGGA